MTLPSFTNKKQLLVMIKNTLLIVLGTFVLAFGTGMFIIPFDLVTGGVSGIGIVLNHLLSGVRFFGELSVEIYASVINWILFFIGLVFLGRRFAAKTLISTIVYPFALSLSVRLASSDAFGGFFNLAGYAEYSEIVVVIATVFGGAVIGTGCALTFLGGGSTGGVDIIAFAICKFFKRLKSSRVIFAIDATIVVLGMFAIDNFVISMLGIASAFVCAIAIDRMFIGESSAFIAQIVSDKYKEINDAVINRMQRTSTVIAARGGYSGEGKVMLIVTFSRNQYADFTAIISGIDKNAFVTVHRAHEINGEGWTYLLPENAPPTAAAGDPFDFVRNARNEDAKGDTNDAANED